MGALWGLTGKHHNSWSENVLSSQTCKLLNINIMLTTEWTDSCQILYNDKDHQVFFLSLQIRNSFYLVAVNGALVL